VAAQHRRARRGDHLGGVFDAERPRPAACRSTVSGSPLPMSLPIRSALPACAAYGSSSTLPRSASHNASRSDRGSSSPAPAPAPGAPPTSSMEQPNARAYRLIQATAPGSARRLSRRHVITAYCHSRCGGRWCSNQASSLEHMSCRVPRLAAQSAEGSGTSLMMASATSEGRAVSRFAAAGGGGDAIWVKAPAGARWGRGERRSWCSASGGAVRAPVCRRGSALSNPYRCKDDRHAQNNTVTTHNEPQKSKQKVRRAAVTRNSRQQKQGLGERNSPGFMKNFS